MCEVASHFDQESLLILQEVMDDEFPDLVNVYIRDSDERLPLLRQAVDRQDPTTVRELAHSFQGASSNVSAQVLASLCYELEKAGRDQALGSAFDQLNAIEYEYQQVRMLLQAMVG